MGRWSQQERPKADASDYEPNGPPTQDTFTSGTRTAPGHPPVRSAGNVVELSHGTSSSPFPTSAKDGGPTSSSGIADAIRCTPGVRLLDHSVGRLAQPIGLHAGRRRGGRSRRATLALFEAGGRRDRPAHASGRASAPRRGRRRALRADRRGDDGRSASALAKEVGAAVAERFGVPVYLYEEASADPARRNLEDIRRGEFEGLAAKMAAPGGRRISARRRRTRRPARR